MIFRVHKLVAWVLAVVASGLLANDCQMTKTQSFTLGSATGMVGAMVGQYFSAKRTAQQLNNPSPSFRQAYKGLFTNIFGTMPILAVQTTANTALKEELIQYNQGAALTVQQKGAASVGAGVLSSAIVSPIGNLWVSQQKPENKDVTTYQAARSMYHHNGISGFYRGIVPTMFKQAARATGLLAAYPAINSEYCRTLPNDTVAAAATGLTVGPVMACITHPLDTVETRMQGDTKKEKYKTMYQAFKDAVKTRQIWNGWRWQLAGSIVNSIAMGGMQDVVKRGLKGQAAQHAID